MLALLLLAQVSAAAAAASSSTLTSNPASATPVPALGTANSAVSGKPRTLADFARERKLGKKGAGSGTLSVAGTPGMPELAPTVSDSPHGGSRSSPGNVRVKSAEADVLSARRALEEEAVRKGMTSEGTAAARRKLIEARRELSDAREAATRPSR